MTWIAYCIPMDNQQQKSLERLTNNQGRVYSNYLSNYVQNYHCHNSANIILIWNLFRNEGFESLLRLRPLRDHVHNNFVFENKIWLCDSQKKKCDAPFVCTFAVCYSEKVYMHKCNYVPAICKREDLTMETFFLQPSHLQNNEAYVHAINKILTEKSMAWGRQ